MGFYLVAQNMFFLSLKTEFYGKHNNSSMASITKRLIFRIIWIGISEVYNRTSGFGSATWFGCWHDFREDRGKSRRRIALPWWCIHCFIYCTEQNSPWFVSFHVSFVYCTNLVCQMMTTLTLTSPVYIGCWLNPGSSRKRTWCLLMDMELLTRDLSPMLSRRVVFDKFK